MNYLTKTPAQSKAESIAQSAAELSNHVESMLKMMHDKLANDAEPQAILDAFGNKAVKVLQDYSAMVQAVKAINPDSTVPEPDLVMFKPNANGTVTYTAPVVEEIAP